MSRRRSEAEELVPQIGGEFLDRCGAPNERARERLRRSLRGANDDELAAAEALLVDLVEAAVAWHAWAAGDLELVHASARGDLPVDPAGRFQWRPAQQSGGCR